MIGIILVVLLVLLLIGAFPGAHNAGWQTYGYGPSGLLGVVLIVVLILVLLGHV